jgi:hypothetical protein
MKSYQWQGWLCFGRWEMQQKMQEHGNNSVAVFKEQPELPAPAKYQLRKE